MVKEVLFGTSLALLVLLVLWGVDVTPFLLLGGIFLFFRYAFEGKGIGRGQHAVGYSAANALFPMSVLTTSAVRRSPSASSWRPSSSSKTTNPCAISASGL